MLNSVYCLHDTIANFIMEVYMLIKPQRRANPQMKKLKKVLQECKRENNLRLWRRVKSIVLYLKNTTPEDISNLLDVGLKSVYRWLNNFNEQGVDGIYEGEHTGRPSLLDKNQLTHLEDILDSGPGAYGLETGIWTSPTIQHVIEEEFGVTYHHDHVNKILHQLGFSVQRPGKKLALANPKLQQKWVRETYPVLKKTA